MFSTQWLSKTILATSLSLPLLASAHLISITATVPFASTVGVSTTSSATYTVTNISTSPLTGIEDQSDGRLPAGVSISSSTCGRTTPLNPGASCTIQLQLTAPSDAAVLSGGLYEHPLPSADGVFSAIGPISVVLTPPAAILTAVGNTTATAPIIVQSTNSGTDWSIPSIEGLPTNSRFNSTSCNDIHSVCTAVGYSGTGSNPSLNSPLLVQTIDSGSSWTTVTATGAPTRGVFNGTHCSGSDTHTFCTAVGNNTAPFLSQTTGNIWTAASISGLLTTGTFSSTHCTGSSNAVCTAVGANNSGASTPLLALTTNGGNDWSTVSFPSLPTPSFFSSTGGSGL